MIMCKCLHSLYDEDSVISIVRVKCTKHPQRKFLAMDLFFYEKLRQQSGADLGFAEGRG